MWITKQQRKDAIDGLTFLYRVATRDPVDAQRRIERIIPRSAIKPSRENLTFESLGRYAVWNPDYLVRNYYQLLFEIWHYAEKSKEVKQNDVQAVSIR